MRFLFAILIFAAGGVFWFLIPGFGLSDNPLDATTPAAPSVSPAESQTSPPANDVTQSATSNQAAISPEDPASSTANSTADTAVESAIRATAQPRNPVAIDRPAGVPVRIATDVRTVVAGIAATIAPEGFDPDRANEIIDMAAIADIQKATLRRLIETTQTNPELLRAALAQTGTVIGVRSP